MKIPYHHRPSLNDTEHLDEHGQHHRENGPAIEAADGSKHWYKHGRRHRENGPAIIYANGCSQEWHINGQRHRENGPAMILEHQKDGEKEIEREEIWYNRDIVQRCDGPAHTIIKSIDGAQVQKTETWYQEGVRHREDGPAVRREQCDGSVIHEWYRDGKRHRENGPAYYDETGLYQEEVWYMFGVFHRENGPAVVENNYLGWYHWGARHRDPKAGPAYIRYSPKTDKIKMEKYYVLDVLHREDGPAQIDYNYDSGVYGPGATQYAWFINNVVHRENGPAIIVLDHQGRCVRAEWRQMGKLHRRDGAAVIDWVQGIEKWCENNLTHRLDGPAIIERTVSSDLRESLPILLPHRVDGQILRDADFASLSLPEVVGEIKKVDFCWMGQTSDEITEKMKIKMAQKQKEEILVSIGEDLHSQNLSAKRKI